MKKIIKNISRVVFSLLLIVSIFGAFNVFAADVIFQITGISVKEKSDKVTVNDVSLSGGSINNDIVFTDQGDYITYDITIKNVTEDDYTIKSITDDNTSSYLEYTYDDLSNVKVNKGESKTFNLTITYKQETSNLTISDQAVSLTLTYEKDDGTTGTETITNDDNNGTTGTETITNDDNNGTTTPDDTNTTGEVKGEQTITNPKTGDNITIYIILGLVSLTGLVITTVSKKHLQKSLMVIALVSLVAIPLGVKADSESFKILFKNNIQNPHYTITYNANGGKFEDDSTKNSVSYLQSKTVIKKYSHTRNIDDNGTKLFGYGEDSVGNQASQPSVVTIDGVSSITVDVYYNTVYDDSIFVLEGAHPNLYNYLPTDIGNLVFHQIGGPGNETFNINGNELVNVGHERFIINDNGVTFDFNSEDEDGSYGYYAIVTGEISFTFGDYKEPSKEGKVFKGWYDNPECTDGHEVDINNISNDKTVYAKWGEPAPYTIISGDINTRGSIIDIDGEQFELIKNYGDKITMRVLYPLNIGPNQKENDKKGIQDSTLDDNQDYGKITFSDTKYWMDGSSVKNKYASTYYIYDENSNAYQYIEDYVDYLKERNPLVLSGRLWSGEESEIYSCSSADRYCWDYPDENSNIKMTGLLFDDGLIRYLSMSRYDRISYDNKMYVAPIIEMSIE